MEIAVHSDSSVTVKATKNSDISLIENKLQKRALWILRQIKYFRQFDTGTTARCCVNGESNLCLGKRYCLKLKKDTDSSVKLLRRFFHVHCADTQDPQSARRILKSWYLEKQKFNLKKAWNDAGKNSPALI
jgi:predicted metal-dependent hydrolase